MFDHNELWAQTEELADLIMQSPEINAYQLAEARMKQHPQASSLLARLKDVQEQVAEFQARQVPPMHYVHLLKESESLMTELEKIPEVAEFQRAQNAVNDLLQTLTRRLARAVLERVGDDAGEGG
ncbi:MAG: YlbF family regulator [Alicyclobacillus sp.]|nr:YlbF family regulator [Alicyclobacillus sp.]